MTIFATDPTWSDGTDGLANAFRYYIDFFHIPTSESVQFKAFLTSLTILSSPSGEEKKFMDEWTPFRRLRALRDLSLLSGN